MPGLGYRDEARVKVNTTDSYDGVLLYLIFLRFYLFIHERHRESGRDIDREVGSPQSPMWDSIPGPGPRPEPRQVLNRRATQASLLQLFKM